MSEEAVAETSIENSGAEISTPETSTQAEASSSDSSHLNQSTETAAPVYAPNHKFKYFDPQQNKQIEKDFDEWIKGAVKDAKTEKEMRDLYEKAYGLEPVKASREKFKTEAEQLRSQMRDTHKSLNMLSQYVQTGDMHSFFDSLKIPEEKVLKYALERLQYRDMSPEQRAQYDNIRSTKTRAEFLEAQNQQYQQTLQETAQKARSSELDQKLSDPNVAQVIQAFDARLGQVGAFKQEVIKRGQYYWHAHKQDIPVEQAVQEVLQIAGGMQPTPASISQPSPAAEPQVKPIIKNIQGTGSSPAKKRPNSLEDLKKMRIAMERN